MEEIIEKIKEANCVTFEIREKYFKGKNFKEIRQWLEDHGLDRHMCIELRSSGVVVIVSNGDDKKAILQIRSSEKNRIGVFGGGVDDNETSKETAIRELKEELSIDVKPEQLKFLCVNDHYLTYINGDKTHYLADVYVLVLDEFPFIKLDFESNGLICLSKETMDDYILPDSETALKINDDWINVIERALSDF